MKKEAKENKVKEDRPANQSFTFCPKCGHTITGNPVNIFCPKCGYRFCPSCSD